MEILGLSWSQVSFEIAADQAWSWSKTKDYMLLKKPEHLTPVGCPFKSALEQSTLELLPLRDAVRSYAMSPLRSSLSRFRVLGPASVRVGSSAIIGRRRRPEAIDIGMSLLRIQPREKLEIVIAETSLDAEQEHG